MSQKLLFSVILLSLICIIHGLPAAPQPVHLYITREKLEKVPPDLLRGILKRSEVKIDLNGKLSIPDYYCLKIYEWIMKNSRFQFSGSGSKLVSFMQKKICFPNGKCIDISDPGIHP